MHRDCTPTKVAHISQVSEFVPEPNFSLLLIGQRNSGKTVAIRNICSKLNEKLSEKLGEYIVFNTGDTTIDSGKYSSDIIESILQERQRNKEKPLTIVFDGVHLDYKDMVLENLFLNHKRYGINIIIATQCDSTPVHIRMQCDIVIIYKTSYMPEIKKLYERYADMCTFRAFNELIKALPRYGGLVIRPALEEVGPVFLPRLEYKEYKCKEYKYIRQRLDSMERIAVALEKIATLMEHGTK